MRLFLVLFGVMIIMQVTALLPTVTGRNKVAEMQLNLWREKLPNVQVPEAVAASMSPLPEEEVDTFVKIIEGGNLRFHATQFCSSANLLCSQAVSVVPAQTYLYIIYILDSDEMSDMFFSAKELREWGQITLPDLYSPWKAFIPRNLSQLIPFSTIALSDVVSSFGLSERSNMTQNMNSTLIACEDKPERGEFKMCTTSIEGMIELVLSNLGSDSIELAFQPAFTGDSGKKARVRKVVEIPLNRPPLACHRLLYPYGVFYCHSNNGSLAFTTELEVLEKNGNIYNVTAICHPQVQRKRSVHCHLIFGYTLLWLSKDKH